MKILQMRCSLIFNEIVMAIGLLVAAFAPISASDSHDDSLNNSLMAMSVQDSASDESMELLSDDAPDVQVDLQQNFVTNTGRVSNFPVRPNVSTKEYNRHDIILRDSLAKSMTYMLMSLFNPQKASDDWLIEIDTTNTQFMDLRVEGRIIPGSKKTKQTALLGIVPREDVDMNEFDKDIEHVVERFKQHGIDVDVMKYSLRKIDTAVEEYSAEDVLPF